MKEPIAVEQPQQVAVNGVRQSISGVHLRRFSLTEFQHLVELGIFGEDERIELLDGLLVEMSPINPRHAECVDNLNETFTVLLHRKARVRVQSPITLEGQSSQPQPGVSVAVRRAEGYGERHMNAAEIFLLIEVADSSLNSDQTDKLKLYAAAGIPEYWIVNLVDNQLEVYQEPYFSATGEGAYKRKRTYSREETVAPQSFPECEVALTDILPKGS
ncbi:MAG: Uma2 family endonuclease [Caldilineaceae bacterium]|nr:Uma2 family endonuclease [Caldilineaceae bacterium]